MPELPGWSAALVASARVGHLATASKVGEPHVVVVCFVAIAERIYTPIDGKPKSGRTLTRVRDIHATGNAALVVDQYDEDWTKLAWVQARGSARVIGPSDSGHEDAVAHLQEKYPQYRMMALDASELIEVSVSRWRWWRWTTE